MKRRHILMGVALAGAAALVLFGDRSPSDPVAEAVERKAPRVLPAKAAAPAATARTGETSILRLVPRDELIGDAGEGSFKSKDGVFGGQSWNPPPPPPPVAESAAAPPPPPTAPPLPFQFLGKAAADGQWEVFLGRGEQTFVVQKGSQIDGTYRVDSISPPTLTMTYLPMNQVQQLNIGAIE